MERMRGPEWFLEKIAAGLEAAGAPPEPAVPVHRKMSRAEIETIVASTLNDELARLDSLEPREPAGPDLSGPDRRTGP